MLPPRLVLMLPMAMLTGSWTWTKDPCCHTASTVPFTGTCLTTSRYCICGTITASTVFSSFTEIVGCGGGTGGGSATICGGGANSILGTCLTRSTVCTFGTSTTFSSRLITGTST